MISVLLLLLKTIELNALENGLARTPPMGWLAWEQFGCNTNCASDPHNCIREELFKEMADHLVNDGYRDAGYKFVNLDDCWMTRERDVDGKLQADRTRFPSGIKALAEYMHERDLKLGIYAGIGEMTCMRHAGSKHHLRSDAQTLASWRVDMLKLDGCYMKLNDLVPAYKEMGRYLNGTGWPIVYSCSFPTYFTWSGKVADYSAVAELCNMWRNADDIHPTWSSIISIIEFYAEDRGHFSKYSRPGAFNDPDMLMVGSKKLPLSQQKAQFALWAVLAAPLLMSNDLRHISDSARDILLNPYVIAVNQDPLGRAGTRIKKVGSVQVWRRELHRRGAAVVLLNTADKPVTFTDTLQNIGVSSAKLYIAFETFSQKTIGWRKQSDSISIEIEATGAYMITFQAEYSEVEDIFFDAYL